jgi:hypothetical protein
MAEHQRALVPAELEYPELNEPFQTITLSLILNSDLERQ